MTWQQSLLEAATAYSSSQTPEALQVLVEAVLHIPLAELPEIRLDDTPATSPVNTANAVARFLSQALATA